MLARAKRLFSNDSPSRATADHIETLKQRTFFGREKENLVYPIALANLILHGIDQPHVTSGMETLLPGPRSLGVFFKTRQRCSTLYSRTLPSAVKRGKMLKHGLSTRQGRPRCSFFSM